MKPKVSVIIPVYNAEKYLEECIDSLINQTLRECEFIFINDGSIDSSLELLQRYKKLDSRIIVISQENMGVSAARNAGIDLADGEYLGFVDADDFVEKDYYENILKIAEHNICDIVISDWITTRNGYEVHSHLSIPLEKIIDKKEINEKMIPLFISEDSLNSVCNKIYNTMLIKDNKIVFPVGIKLGEDRAFNIKAFSKASSCYYTNYYGYYYREVEGSATHNLIKHDYFKRLLEVYNEKFDCISNLKIKEIDRLKSEKFISGVISLTYICFDSKDSLNNKFKYISLMINNQTVQIVTKKYGQGFINNRGRYDRAVLKCIENKNILGIYFLTQYSRFRNRKRRINDEDNDV